MNRIGFVLLAVSVLFVIPNSRSAAGALAVAGAEQVSAEMEMMTL